MCVAEITSPAEETARDVEHRERLGFYWGEIVAALLLVLFSPFLLVLVSVIGRWVWRGFTPRA